jgi:hypothetical protein
MYRGELAAQHLDHTFRDFARAFQGLIVFLFAQGQSFFVVTYLASAVFGAIGSVSSGHHVAALQERIHG